MHVTIVCAALWCRRIWNTITSHREMMCSCCRRCCSFVKLKSGFAYEWRKKSHTIVEIVLIFRYLFKTEWISRPFRNVPMPNENHIPTKPNGAREPVLAFVMHFKRLFCAVAVAALLGSVMHFLFSQFRCWCYYYSLAINYQMYSAQNMFRSQCLLERGINSYWFYLYIFYFFDRIVQIQTDWMNPLCSAHETVSDLNNTPWHIASLLTLASQWSRW